MARKSKEVPEINAGSMADIAFLLLIFFLVTTTMDQDSGISRKLPAKVEEPVETPPVIHDRNIFIVLLNQNNQLLVEEKPMEIDDLKEATIDFITNNGKSDVLSDSPDKAIVSLRNHRLTSYDAYVSVQDQLTAAYNQVRNSISNQRFGKPFDDLTKEQIKEIRKDYPMNISEAEPIKD